MKKSMCIVVGAVLSTTVALADFIDDFDGTSLDSNWTVVSDDSSWSPSVASSYLQLTGLNNPNQSTWANTTLTRDLGASMSGDFLLTLKLNWNYVDNKAIQRIKVQLLDVNDAVVGQISLLDSQYQHSPQYDFEAEGTSWGIGYDILPNTQTSDVVATLSRVNGSVSSSWDGTAYANQATSSAAVSKIRISIMDYNYNNDTPFKDVNIDSVSLAIPEPAALVLIFSAGISFIGLHRFFTV